jgi:carbonic anhydrase
MKKPILSAFFIFLLISLMLCSCEQKKKVVTSPKKEIISQGSLQRLIEGNKRFVNNKLQHPNQNEERRREIVLKQSPYAVIVGCSDSRVPPEIIFDEGLGDLFVVRVAGNVIGPIELESIGYAVLHLHPAVILVLGHENCGAVDAVIKHEAAKIEEIAKLIEPAVNEAQKQEKKNLYEHAIKANALNMKNLLEKSPNIEPLIRDKKIEVHAAYYNLETGFIELLND